MPPSVLIGFEGRHRFVYTDTQSGDVKVICQPYMTIESVLKFISAQMQPLHYGDTMNTFVITPRYVLKIIDPNQTSRVQIYYCH